jgi:acyl dehydratase
LALVLTREQFTEFIGKRLVGNRWLEIDQARINGFADITGDHQFIHVNPAAARATPYGSTIAHGYLTLSLLPMLLEPIQLQPARAAWGINYGLDRLRFINPVRVGAEIRAASTLHAVEARAPDRILMKSEVEVEIRGVTRPALVAETLAMWILADRSAVPS